MGKIQGITVRGEVFLLPSLIESAKEYNLKKFK